MTEKQQLTWEAGNGFVCFFIFCYKQYGITVKTRLLETVDYKNLQAEILQIKPPIYKNHFSLTNEAGSYLEKNSKGSVQNVLWMSIITMYSINVIAYLLIMKYSYTCTKPIWKMSSIKCRQR